MLFKLRATLAFLLTLAGFFATLCWTTAGTSLPISTGPSYRLFNSSSSLPRTDFAIVTFLTGQGENDAYFTATRILAHQLLHAPSTKINSSSITCLVLCSQTVSRDQKERLRKDGATVVEVEDVPLSWWIHSGVQRWQEQFNKLRVFEMTEYKRILYIDADTILNRPMDDIFEEPEVTTLAPMLLTRKDQIRRDEGNLPTEWFFAARSDNAFSGEREHPVPPLQTLSFSAGFFMVAPDRLLFEHLLAVMSHFRRFDPFTMEQSLLNYVFRREGTMPWRELSWRWSATWPSEKDLDAGVASLHEKLWLVGPQPLKDLWNRKKGEMLHFYEVH